MHTVLAYVVDRVEELPNAMLGVVDVCLVLVGGARYVIEQDLPVAAMPGWISSRLPALATAGST